MPRPYSRGAQPERDIVAEPAAGLAAADQLMPASAGLVLPRLNGVREVYPRLGNEATAAMVARSLLEADIARPEHWHPAQGSATKFIELSLDSWLDCHGRSKVEQNFFLTVALSDRVDPNSWRAEDSLALPEKLYISVDAESAGYVVFGPTLRLLEKVHPRFPATFYRYFMASVERWVRVYDYRDGMERVEQMREYWADEPEAGYEVPDVEGAIPRCMKVKPLCRRAPRQFCATARGQKPKQLIHGILDLIEKADIASRPPLSDEVSDQLQDNNPPVPVLLAVFEKSDAIEGCFDAESQVMLEMPPEPNVVLPLNGADPGSVREAFVKLGAMTETLAAASELIVQMPGNKRVEEAAE
jgi:hypothetical protein